MQRVTITFDDELNGRGEIYSHGQRQTHKRHKAE